LNTGYAVGEVGEILKTLNGGVGIIDDNKNPENNQLIVYPDPAQNKITIKIDQVDFVNMTDLKMLIYNIQGQLISMQSIKKPITDIDITPLSQGVYFVRLILNNGNIIQKKFVVIK